MSTQRDDVLVQELKNVPVFQDLSDPEIRTLIQGSRVRRFNNSDPILFKEGDRGDGVYIILRGEVEVYKVDRSGAEFMLTVLPAGDFVGEMALLEDKPRSAHARAKGEVLALFVTRNDYVNLVGSQPAALSKLFLRMLSTLSERLRLLNEHYVLTKGCLERLKNF